MTDTQAAAQAGEGFAYGRIWLIGAGFLGVQVAFTLYNAFLPLMYREFFDSTAAIGLLMGTDNLLGLLLIPVIGAWSDRINSRLGRRLPFMLVAVPIAALSFAGIPYAANVLWTLILVEIIFTAAMHSYRGPVISLMPDHVPPERRSTGNGIINLMGGVGVLIAFGGLSLLYDIDPRLPFGIGAVILLATLGVVYLSAERHPPYVDDETDEGARPIGDAIAGFKVLLSRPNRGQFLVLAAMLTYFIGFAGLDAMFPIYGVEELGLTEGRAAFILTFFAGSFLLFALVAGMLGTRFGKIPTMLAGLAILPVLFLAATPVRSAAVIGGLFIVGGFAWGLVNVQAMPLVADLGGRDRIGFYVGMYYLFTMFGQMLGPFVLGSAMDLVGNQGMFYAGAGAFIGGFILLRAGQKALGTPPEELARRQIGDLEDALPDD
ncbi:MAG: MFS transporter [Intrasporangiaceae bacterium]|nr:MFS transporter [Intrasporangiaceae bacterium]